MVGQLGTESPRPTDTWILKLMSSIRTQDPGCSATERTEVSANNGVAALAGQFGVAGGALHDTKNFLEFSKGAFTLVVLSEKTQVSEFGVGVLFEYKNPAVSKAAARAVLGVLAPFLLI